jgi:hypothetical protein
MALGASLVCGCSQDFATARIAGGEVMVQPQADGSVQVVGGFTVVLSGAEDHGADPSRLHIAYLDACGVVLSDNGESGITWTKDFPLIVEPGDTREVLFSVDGSTWGWFEGGTTCSVDIRFEDLTRYDYDDSTSTFAEGHIAVIY